MVLSRTKCARPYHYTGNGRDVKRADRPITCYHANERDDENAARTISRRSQTNAANFRLVAPEAFDRRQIPLRHPIRFYEGHLASFNFGMLLQSGFVKSDPQPELTTLFARGIDPLDTSAADKLTIEQWPDRATVADYLAQVEDEMTRAFEADIDPIY